MIEHLPSMCEALGSIPSIARKIEPRRPGFKWKI